MNSGMHMAFLEGVGGGELLLVMVAALMLFGSKNLPKIARSLGRTTEQLRKAVHEVKTEILRADVEPPPPPVPLPLLKPSPHLAERDDEPNKGKPDEPPAG